MSKNLRIYEGGKVLSFPGKSLEDIPADLAGSPAVEYEYYGSYCGEKSQNCHGWKFEGNGQSWALVDCRGEKSPAGDIESAFKILFTYKDWSHYRKVMEAERIKTLEANLAHYHSENNELKSEIFNLHGSILELKVSICFIFDLNEAGGSGSRKKVREECLRHIEMCGGCRKAICNCERKES